MKKQCNVFSSMRKKVLLGAGLFLLSAAVLGGFLSNFSHHHSNNETADSCALCAAFSGAQPALIADTTVRACLVDCSKTIAGVTFEFLFQDLSFSHYCRGPPLMPGIRS